MGRVNTNITHMLTIFVIQITSQEFMIHVHCTAVGLHNFRCVLLSFNNHALKLKKMGKVNNNNNNTIYLYMEFGMTKGCILDK